MTQARSFWSVPKMWQGATAAIIGGGPSLIGFDWNLLRQGVRVIGCNDAYQLGPWVDICHFGDIDWYFAHRKQLSLFPGLKTTSIPAWEGIYLQLGHDILAQQRVETGISHNPRGLGWNGNTGASAINLAYLLGCRRILLLGFDMQPAAGNKPNWHPNAISPQVGQSTYDHFRNKFVFVADGLKGQAVEVINCNMQSRLDLFPKQPLEEVLCPPA